ncbi:glycosyltransferase [Plantactinospora siamensis]|uniref:Glycosyltransferase n=1 Tax=Plantactinospora siamensis TaxID=555372 RepID=A0ABV6P260_9ACTN
MSQDVPLVDIAGSELGGAARWRIELEGYLSEHPGAADPVGFGQRITPAWLLRRDRLARDRRLVIAANNISFVTAGAERRLLLRNALHFLDRSEERLLAGMPRAFRIKIAVVRRLATRADLVVVPTSTMAERVLRRLPTLATRLVVRPHPVSPMGARRANPEAFILAPVVPGPYKNLIPQLRLLASVADRIGHPARILVTARPRDLPADLSANPRVTPVGTMPPEPLARLWRSCWAAFYPSALESFGYPLAEARVYGVPIIAPDRSQSRELAGAALRGYHPSDPHTLEAALAGSAEAPTAEPDAFDRDGYFASLLDRSRAASVDSGTGRRPATQREAVEEIRAAPSAPEVGG